MSQEALEKFSRFVFTDQPLQQQLRPLEDRLEFIAAVVSLGSDYGFEFTADDVENSLLTNRRTWIERWI